MEKEDVLRKIRGLLDRADHPNTPAEEASSCRVLADKLMTKYSVEAYEAMLARPAHLRERPTVKDVVLIEDSSQIGDWTSDLLNLFGYLADLSEVKLATYGWRMIKVVGFAHDIEYLEMLYTKVRLHMSANLDPKPSPSLTWVENLAKLKRAGFKWEDIHYRMSQAGLPDYPYTGQRWVRSIGINFTKTFTAHCERTGESRTYDSPSVYRRSFVDGYVEMVRLRVVELKRSRRGEQAGKGLVLASKEKDIMEAMYEAFPNLRPHPADCDCDRCHYCGRKDCTRRRCEDSRRPVRMSTARLREVKYSQDAVVAGRNAGATVDLSHGSVSDRRKEIQ